MREESPKDEEAARKRLSAVTPKSPLGGGKNGRGAVARRLQALRDSGPGSGTWGAWLKSRRRRRVVALGQGRGDHPPTGSSPPSSSRRPRP